jgi:hypothetical protein
MVAPGRWVYTQTVELNHANLNRIAIQGGALLGASPTPPNLSVSGYHSASDGTNQILYLRSVYATELAFTGGVTGFAILAPGATLRYLLITGSQTIGSDPSGYTAGNGCYVLEELFIDGIAIWGFGYQGLQIFQASVLCISSLSVTISYCWNGIVIQGGIFSAYSDTAYTNLVSNAVSGITAVGSDVWFGRVYIAGHGPPDGNAAIQCIQGGLIACAPGGHLQINQSGIIAAGAASIIFEYATINNHSSYGCYTYGTATVWLNYSNMYANAGMDVWCTNGSFVDATGATLSSGHSPEYNTYNTANDAFLLH